MTLTLAIPVHNDRDALLCLLARAGDLGCFAQAVVVDDGSDTALEAEELARALNMGDGALRLFRHDTPLGPGPARNRALEMVETSHLLFLDSDDSPTRELPHLLGDLAGRDFDFCLFQHHDTRQEQSLIWGQMSWDQQHWQDAGLALGALNPVSPDAAAHLVRVANYPWNKIYRTAFLRDHAIACSEILLHEDVELHWRSFLNAKTILASDRIGVIHVVNPGGTRMTNRTGPERLGVFAPLQKLATEIKTHGHTPYALPFARFATGLIAWISGNLDPAHQEQLETLTRTFMQNYPSLMSLPVKP